jgi:hypothetical protein
VGAFVRAIAAIVVVGAAFGWLLAAEERGPLPSGRYLAAPIASWPVTDRHADAIRRDALSRAAVRIAGRPATGWSVHPGSTVDPLDASPVTCLFLSEAPTGTSAKFDCVLDGGDVVKIKYGRNPEIHAEVAASRLLTALGFAADEVRMVPRLRCFGCPRLPFFAMQMLSLVRRPQLLTPHGHQGGFTEFEWVSVERKFPAPAIETRMHEGWDWWELADSRVSRADLDAFRLLAIFLAHWDNKSTNQRLVCLDALPQSPDVPCLNPLLMIDDLGATFGPLKVNLAAWRDLPVWHDRRSCQVSMRALPFDGGTFPDAVVSDAGRLQLALALAALTERDIEQMFIGARFPDYHSSTDDRRDVRAWTDAFRGRVGQIAAGGTCPEA